VCNLYDVHTTQEAMRRAFDVGRDSVGNLPPLPAIFPGQLGVTLSALGVAKDSESPKLTPTL
jgi:hypothetical protein